FVQRGGVDVDTDLDGVVHRRATRQLGGEWATGQRDDLKRAHDAASVAGKDPRRRRRVDRAQPFIQWRWTSGGELRLQPPAYAVVRTGEIEVVKDGTHVESGSADQHRYPPPGADLIDGRARQALVDGHARWLS